MSNQEISKYNLSAVANMYLVIALLAKPPDPTGT